MSVVLEKDTISFFYIEATLNNVILIMNDRLKEEINNTVINESIETVFDEWKPTSGGNLIQARLKDKNFIFIKDKISGNRFVYVGIVSAELEKKSEEVKELQRLNLHLDAIIESSYDGIYITDKDGITLRTNSAIERITGIPKEYYINKKVDDLVKRGILENSITDKVIQKKKSVTHIQLSYSGRETLLTGNPVFNENGEVESVVTNIRDLSELNSLQKALSQANKLNESYQKEIERLKGSASLFGGKTVVEADQMKLIYDTASRIADVSATVLILGETGVGKDVLAKYIYNKSERKRSGTFVKVNCGAIPPDLLESELFGYAPGAFTGANKQGKPGLFELADKGVLFLDEVGEMPSNLQVKLLKVIQEKEIQRVGGTVTKKVDVRIIAATNRNLKEMVQLGTFREDLFYRLNVVPLFIPALRERRKEIPSLISLFLEQINQKYNTAKVIDSELNAFFYKYSFPGNIRELSNVLEQLVLLNSEDLLGLRHLPEEYQSSKASMNETEIQTLKEVVEHAERKYLSQAAINYTTTYELAKALDTSQPTIVRKLKKYNIRLNE
ncbi:sigma 54-interacting transcriptional regulator [Fictibacillus sp. 5RED26]|uniref:sigma-54 interaction domain-containing protein n=1 Tax=Fictibacillus sp. 5RED26 TaxID=2745876 RepID=UPI0018CDDD06|nr:sigma 54-interacting transcriptional regulator [Fictibacillus sp. 5RED26]MBH0155690.1 sigma 54-interacting transcriptional regulator [Fictibacillus sp. 5RED26]